MGIFDAAVGEISRRFDGGVNGSGVGGSGVIYTSRLGPGVGLDSLNKLGVETDEIDNQNEVDATDD